jgi:CHAT domain-containing protein/tetratricopeptide (TPR) repeat protein
MPRPRFAVRALAALLPALPAMAIAVALSACSSHDPPQPVFALKCQPISKAQPVELSIVPSVGGTLRVAVEQRGISVVTALSGTDARQQPWSLSARSPIERFGIATFTQEVKDKQPVAVSISSRDSPDIVGEVCISADRLQPSDGQRLRAERTFAAAAQAVQAGSWRHAFDLYGTAARAFRSIDDWRVAQSRYAMAEIAYEELDQDDAAYVLASWALADFGAGADADLRSRLLALQTRTTLESERLPPELRSARVFELSNAAEAVARRARFGAREVPRIDILRGFMEFRNGRAREAGALFTRAAQRCTELRDWECDAAARQNIATLAEEARDYSVALQAYHDVLTTLPEDLQPKLSASIWGNYGRLQAKAGLLRQAELSHRKSVRLHANAADCDGTRMNLARLGTLLVQVGSVGEGHVYLARASSLECPALIAAAKSELASNSASSMESAVSGVGKTTCVDTPDVEALSEGGKIAVFNGLIGLIDASRLENNHPQALRCLAAARPFAITPRTQLRLANAEGAALLQHRDAVKARAAFERGLAIADRANLPPTHENRSRAYIGLARAALLDSRPAEARALAAQALRLGVSRADLGQVVESLQWIGRGFRAEQANESAVTVLRTAAALIEQVPIDDLDAEQRATWLATQHDVFSELTTLYATDVHNDEARAWEAFAISERGHARAFRYAMSQATDTRATSSSEPDSARYRELMRKLTELEQTHATSGAAIPVEALADLVETRPEAADPSALAALRQRLAALDATVVEYAAGGDNLFAFVIDSDHIHVVPLGSRVEIGSAATALYERLRNPESAAQDVRNAARRLAALTLWPLAELVTHRRVIFVPDDVLHTVPFAVLPWDADAQAPLTVQRVELAVMPSALFVSPGAQRAARESAPRLELIGDPVFRASDWLRECERQNVEATPPALQPTVAATRSMDSLPRLPGSRKEVAAIAELAREYSPGSRVREHLGCAATPAALRAAAATNPTLLHIATHGYVDAYRPRLSALVLTPETNTNGAAATFGLLDILQLKIDSRLVVLSACDTSRGKLLPGEGVLGPAQAFLQAGAASVVASYWRVADEATAPFMRTFYRYLFVEHLTAAAALRQAQLDHARQGGAYDWAAFTLFGQPDTQL